MYLMRSFDIWRPSSRTVSRRTLFTIFTKQISNQGSKASYDTCLRLTPVRRKSPTMCNIAAALGVGLLLMMGGNRGSKDKYEPPVAPQPKTNYGGTADSLANTNQNLPNDGAGSPDASSQIVSGIKKSPGRTGYRNSLSASMRQPQPAAGIPTIGSLGTQKPVNY